MESGEVAIIYADDLAAGRLSEDPSITVAVIEAGESNLDDPNILVPGQFGKTFGNPKARVSSTTRSITC